MPEKIWNSFQASTLKTGGNPSQILTQLIAGHLVQSGALSPEAQASLDLRRKFDEAVERLGEQAVAELLSQGPQ